MKNLVQKILQPHTEQEVIPGHVITSRISLALANDITAPLAIKSFRSWITLHRKKILNQPCR
jgi:3-isopropylmalate/(R)-2-methylmalate dehydratase large subunit